MSTSGDATNGSALVTTGVVGGISSISVNANKVWRILIADDTELTRQMLASALKESFEVIFAKDGL